MSPSVFAKTLRDMRDQILGWGVGIGLLGAVMVLMYPTIRSMPGLLTFLENLPAPFKAFMGDVSAMTLLEGLLKAKLFDYLPLLLSIFTITHAAGAIAGEEEHRTLDMLMAQPVGRARILLEKFAAIAVATALICALAAVLLTAATWLVEVQARRLHLLASVFNALPTALISGGIALVGSCVYHRQRQAASLAAALVLAAFFMHALGLIIPALHPWQKLSVFYYHAQALPLSGGFRWPYLILQIVLLSLLLLAALGSFARKDLRV